MAPPKKKKPARRKKKKAPELNLPPAEVLKRFTDGPFDGVFTDGACTGNPGPGGWGFVWVENNEVRAQAYGDAPRTTNNRMELTALVEAYKLLPKDAEVDLYSDSDLCVRTLNEWAESWRRRGWKRKTGPVENLDLVQEAYELHRLHPRCSLQWIKAHNGSRWNEYADSLATVYVRGDAPATFAPEESPKAGDGLDVGRLRRETPGCENRVHWNNAGASLMPRPVIDAVTKHLELESLSGGYEAAEARHKAIDDAYAQVARLIGCEARNVAMTTNATDAFARTLSAIPFERGDVLLTTRADYVSNQIMYLSLGRRFGIEVVRAPDLPEGGADPEAAAALVRQRRPKLVSITQMPSMSGVLQSVTPIAAACREADVPLLVDACQTVGQLPLDVKKLGCDFLAAPGRKFLRGPRGTGFLYVSDRRLAKGAVPLLADLRGVDWSDGDELRTLDTARRFETWELSYALVLGLGAAARYANVLDGKLVSRRSRELAAELRRRLAEVDGVRVLDRGAWLGAIATFAVDGWEPEKLLHELRRRRINASIAYRSHARLDFADKDVEWALRFSPHYYNTEGELGVVVGALAELQSQR